MTWTETREDTNRQLCQTELRALDDLSHAVSEIGDWDSQSSGSFAKFFRDKFRLLLSEAWIRDFMLIPLPRNRSSAVNFIADAVLALKDCECGFEHQIRVEISFDNRQIIGTNVLKMLVSGDLIGDDNACKNLGVLICASKEAKKTFGLDPAVGSSDEYLLAIENGYASIISMPIFLGVIRGSSLAG